ncbi:AraC family transcriptional regulator [Gallaecimonas mangrovi]|uniref:AraC family transcriptional regulator n=1 Tax=Gallaecimonas mangrovi TaxID=2291597 RepID=UPI001D0051C8|nr:helix-turn-helix transcriptional regulator [Gallaecimonas mangrovi]
MEQSRVRMPSSVLLESAKRSVVTLKDDYPANHYDGRHRHDRGEFLYATNGVMVVTTDTSSFVVPPHRGLWIPAGIYHAAHVRSSLSLHCLFIEQGSHPGLPDSCMVVGVSELLRSLIVQAMLLPAEYDESNREGRIMQLIVDEIALMSHEPLLLPMPQDTRLLKVCQQFLNDPTQEQDLSDWADVACMSRRSFTRLFRQQTQLSFTAWRQQARLNEALSRLSNGAPITTVAMDVGYNSSSAFSAAFHKVFGVPPSKFATALS